PGSCAAHILGTTLFIEVYMRSMLHCYRQWTPSISHRPHTEEIAMMSERLNLTVDDGISELLVKLAGSRNKMGETVSNLVRAASTAEQIPAASDVETLRLMIMGLSAEIKRMKRKISAAHELLGAHILYNRGKIYRQVDQLDLDRETEEYVLMLDGSHEEALEGFSEFEG